MKKFFVGLMIVAVGVFPGCVAKDKAQENVVVLETSQGIIELTLYPDVAPKACENFKKLVKKGYYNGVVFHRVIRGFMVQSGDPTGTGMGGESASGLEFEDELSASVKFDREGLLAMANRGPDTNTSQFFITTAARPELNMRYTIFGEVTSGYDAVTAIEGVGVDGNHKPYFDQTIRKAYLKNIGWSLG